MAIIYSNIPTNSKWQSDSSVALATRAKDVILTRIDELVEHWNASPTTRYVTLPDLYFTLDYWLKSQPSNRTLEKGRLPAIQALYTIVAHSLCGMFNCTINALPRELELMFGREMTNHGVKADHELKMARYMDRAEAETYRLRFKGGRAYQFNWFAPGAAPKLVPANSSYGANPAIQRAGSFQMADYSGFVMSMSRAFYMAKHVVSPRGSEAGTFHSSYLGDQAVSAAGTIFIKDGVVGAIRPDSGHYMPGDVNMLAALQALQMFGVPLNNVAVLTLKGDAFAPALDFITKASTRQAYRDSREQALDRNAAGHAARRGPDLSLFPTVADMRNRWAKPPQLPPGFNPAAFKSINI